MNTNTNEMNMKELNLDEMEQVNGGSYIDDSIRFIKLITRNIKRLLEEDD